MDFDQKSLEALGGRQTITTVIGVMRYVAGCMRRERERLAEAIRQGTDPEDVAKRIMDDSQDADVFRWIGPEHGLKGPSEVRK